jgi:hypothetical protein
MKFRLLALAFAVWIPLLAQQPAESKPAPKPKAGSTQKPEAAKPAEPVGGASTELRRQGWLLDKEGLALQGYDPLSYFDAGGPKPGSKDHTYTFRGVTYRFVSKANRDAFAADPLKWEPPYGGWCAFAVIDGDKVEIDPTNFEVIEGKVYLFYKGFWGDARAKWDSLVKAETAAKIVAKADAGWRKLEAKDQTEVEKSAKQKAK